MNKKIISWMVGGISAVGLAAALFFVRIHADAQQVQASAVQQGNAMAQLNQDLIQTKVDLEGWQAADSQGELASSQYRAAFDSSLASMHNSLQGDAQAL